MGRVFPILAVVLGCACLAAPAQADFGFSEFDVAFKDASGLPESQAGSHPFVFETAFEANVSGGEPEGRLSELLLDEMPGLTANPFAAPRCAAVDFNTIVEGLSDCSGSTVVGVFEGAAGEPDNWIASPVFSLVAPAGVPLRLGFRVAEAANVVVDFELSSEPPYRLLATIDEVPEAIELFAGKLQLWGVPASSQHDESRGYCLVFEGSCPTSNPLRVLLTLPTNCEGQQDTFYEALSWEFGEDQGVSSSPGLSGCARLAFSPSATVQLTTQAAQGPTDLKFSLSFFDEGLVYPAGIAQSQLRDLVLTLPEGMAIDSSAVAGLGICAESDFEDEGPEDAVGEGCPSASQVGTLEVESPLLGADILAGSVYLGTPLSELAKGSPVVLYAVARNAALGVVIKQEIELEPDPATGQLVVYAEDLPQLPFSSFDLDLFAGDSPLITPPRCGDYEIETLLTPWAEDVDYRLLSKFSLDTGPGGGPCPSDAASEPSSHADPPPAASPSTESVALPAVTRRKVRRCPKGKRAVRRKGKRVCIRRCRKGKRLVRRKGKLRCVKVKKRTHRKHRRRGR